MLCRSEAKAQELKEKYGLPSTTSEELCDEAKPDFVVVAIRSPFSFAYIKKWSDKGYPILTETPAAGTIEDPVAVVGCNIASVEQNIKCNHSLV